MNADKAYLPEQAERYDRGHFGGRSGQHILRKDYAALAALLPPPPGRILDIPCGTGIYTQLLCEQGYDVVAADASKPMLEITAGRGTQAETQWCSIHDLPFAEGAFDATITLRLFSHFSPEWTVQALQELRRVTRLGGRVIFDSFRWTPRRWPVVRRFMDQGSIHEMAPNEVGKLIREAGLHVDATESRYLFSPIWQRKLPLPVLRAITAVEGLMPDRWLLRTFWACVKND